MTSSSFWIVLNLLLNPEKNNINWSSYKTSKCSEQIRQWLLQIYFLKWNRFHHLRRGKKTITSNFTFLSGENRHMLKFYSFVLYFLSYWILNLPEKLTKTGQTFNFHIRTNKLIQKIHKSH